MKMSHALTNVVTITTMPSKVSTTFMPLGIARPTFFNPSCPSSLTPSDQLSSCNGKLIVNLAHRRPLLLAHAVNGVPSVDHGKSGEFLEIELKVRDYEVDQYGVVNNAVYSSYCQHAHHELLVSLGLDVEPFGRSQPVAVSDLSFKFLAPLKNREKFAIKVRVSHFSVARIFIEHFIHKLPNYEPILEAKSTLVWLDENHRPIRIPSYFRFKLSQSGLSK